ncbi:MAG: preprotein translocase subunit SecG [Marinicella sp.]
MSEINFLNIIQVLVAIALIGFILIQRGPGATAGSAFGGGASGTVFGAKGSGSFLTKATAILATAFFIITMLIAVDASDKFASTGDAAEQDLGVFGSLDDASAEPVMNTLDSDASTTDALTDVVNAADDAVEEVATDVQETAAAVEGQIDQAVDEAAEVVDDSNQATESDDTDGGNDQ